MPDLFNSDDRHARMPEEILDLFNLDVHHARMPVEILEICLGNTLGPLMKVHLDKRPLLF